jgi:Tol biopolymer transport system component
LDIALKHKSEAPPDPRKTNARIPDGLSRLILKCLEKTREKRFQNAGEIRSELEKIEEEIPDTERDTFKTKPAAVKDLRVKLNLKKLWLPAIVLASVALVVMLSFLVIKTLPSKKAISPTHTQLTFSGNVSSPAISPDGNFLAYVESEKRGEQNVIIQDRLNSQTVEVFRGRSCGYLKWLPDSSELSFSAFPLDDSQAYSYVVPRLGGAARRLPHSPVGSWSPDGSRFTWVSRTAREIAVVDRSTGDFRRIPLKADFQWFVSDDWSPLGNFLLFLMIDKDNRYAVWTLSPDGKNQNRIVDEGGAVFSPRWSPTGDSVYYFRRNQDNMELWKVRVSPDSGKAAKSPELVLGGLQAGEHFSLASDGKKLATTRELTYSNLWMVTVDDPGTGTSVKTQQLTTGTFSHGGPRISPDGGRIAYSRRTGDSANIFIMSLEGGEVRQVTYLDSRNTNAAWSPDGKAIAFCSDEGGSLSVWKVSAVGGNPYRFAKTKLSENRSIAWSPGKSVLYQKPGNRNFIILDPISEEERPLVGNEMSGWMFNPRWSPDGQTTAVFWNRTDGKGRGTWIIALDDSTPQRIKGDRGFPVGWTRDGKWLYFVPEAPGVIRVVMVHVESGLEKEAFTLSLDQVKGTPMLESMGISPAGRHFVFPVSETNSDVWLIENFDPDKK